MTLWNARDLRQATGGTGGSDATGVSIDTRTLTPGDLFVALVGENGDGHRFVGDALARGAACAMVHADIPGLAGDARLLRVADTLAGLAGLGRFARARCGARVAAITGSVGKTTAKAMLARILASRGPTHAAVASYNNHWGLPLTLARMPPDIAYAVVEIGMNHPREIAPLARLARPHVALITAIAPVHIGHLGSLEAIAIEKGSLFEGLEPDGIAILPVEAAHVERLRRAAGAHRVLGFGTGEDADARLLAAASTQDAVRLRARVLGTEVETRLAAPGTHMAMNATAAMLAAGALGVPPGEAAAALGGFAPVRGRGERRVLRLAGGEALLLDESYNASAISVRAALAVLALQPARRRIAVLGDMLELGEAGPAEHLSLVAEVGRCADRLFACGPLMRQLFDAVPQGLRGAWAADSSALAPLVAADLRAGDAVLVKGSLGSRMARIVAALEEAAA
ncbi:MAG: UDP-N-acetylmuramoyl-tripeptide--D-alanyl-D-alanine ligase [Rhodospirillales bacterium]|nr:UDP-N-acetylmuramoyl-tripeptide--D-alanyl-D-alanine ligase [Rhodospirillales bacterium]